MISIPRERVFRVTDKAMRPASSERRCFYCQEPVGGTHKNDCVLVKRRVTIRMVVEYDVTVPAAWDADQIECHRNEGSWCADNAIQELEEAFRGSCMCSAATFAYVKEAGEPFLDEE